MVEILLTGQQSVTHILCPSFMASLLIRPGFWATKKMDFIDWTDLYDISAGNIDPHGTLRMHKYADYQITKAIE